MRKIAITFLLLALILMFISGCASVPKKPAARSTDYDVIIVGAGMGGLSAGAHLASNGMKVLILEQHHKVGGCTTSFSRGEFNFETALHEMTGGGGHSEMRKLLEKAGVYDKIELIKIPDLYRSVFPGLDFTYPGDFQEAIERTVQKWPEEEKGIREFHAFMKDVYEQGQEIGDLYLMTPNQRLNKILLVPSQQPQLFQAFLKPAQYFLDKYLKNPALKAMLAQFWVYYGPPPEDLWGVMFFSATYSYLKDGAWHIKGSSQALSNAYAQRIMEMGGTVKTGTRVTKINIEDGFATGVETEWGDSFTARYVVSNADPFQTFFKLVGKDKTPKSIAKKLNSMELSNSLIGIYLGLDVEPKFWNCKDHEIFYNSSYDAAENYKNMMEANYDKAAVAITYYNNLGDPFYAPRGKSVLVLHAYSDIATWSEDPETYQAQKLKAAEQLVGLAENVLPGLGDHIEVQEIITPVTLKNFTMQKDGIPYGWNFTVKQGLRLANDTPIGGLYLASSWTNPGHGVSTAQISGYQAAMLILQKEKEK